ncbi:MAG: glycerophosphodiester phosphodiesterase family protein [Gammaproteobacteria bacterium]|nr:glycerophosphodiester phosphodiesterase family protein [Gammaproteobacteria bacterium]
MQLFAHRGNSAKAPENSMQAFQLALAEQADGIELDVHWAAGDAMVIHDADIDRTTNATGAVATLAQSQWQQLDAGDGHPPPSLDQVLALVAGRCQVNIELKCSRVVPVVVRLLTKAIAEYGFSAEQLCVSAFDHHALMALRSQLPEQPVAPLISACHLDYAACAEPFAAQAIHTYVETTNQALVDDAHARGLVVRVYTVSRAEDLLYMRELGVDAVIVDDIAWARDILRPCG